MTKQEFLAASLPYGLKLMQLRKHYSTPQKDRVVTLDGIADICGLLPSVIYNNEAINFYTVFYRVDESTSGSDSDIQFIPIVRSLDALVKECVQADYNDGKPFIPAIELIKLQEKYNKWKDIAPTIPFDIEIFDKPFGKELKVSMLDKWVVFLSLNEIERAKYYIISQLLKWHFDLFGGIESGEAIDVNTLSINPYK